jgi:hypothetical protein
MPALRDYQLEDKPRRAACTTALSRRALQQSVLKPTTTPPTTGVITVVEIAL